jgi:hypothetical protein
MSAAAYPGITQVTEGRDRGTMYGLIGANQKIPAGAYIAAVSGFWVNVTTTTGLEGRVAKCLKDVDNTGGADGAKRVEVKMLGNRKLDVVKNDVSGSPVTATDIGDEFYWLDNQTATLDATGRSVGGRVWGFVVPTFTSANANSDLFVEIY